MTRTGNCSPSTAPSSRCGVHAYPVWRDERRTLLIDDARGVYAYACGRYVVILNNSADAVRVKLSGRADSVFALLLATDGGAVYQAGSASLPPYGGIVVHG